MTLDDEESYYIYHSKDKSYDKMTMPRCVHKVLSRHKELNTQEIYDILKENGKTFNAKEPVKQIYSVLHKAVMKHRYDIARVGKGKWGLIKDQQANNKH